MTDTKISAMTDGSPAQSGDEIPAARSGANVRITAGDIAALATSTPSDFQPAIVTGNYYYAQNVGFSSQSLYGGLLLACPIWFSSTETWTRIGLKVTTGDTGKSVRLGIYSNSASNTPGALLVDCGALSLTTPGDLEITISRSLKANTAYWLAAVADTDAGAPNAVAAGYTATFGTPVFNTAGHVFGTTSPADPLNFTYMGIYGRPFAYAALPDPWGTPDGTVYDMPAVWLRKV